MTRDQAAIVFRQEVYRMCLWIEDDTTQAVETVDVTLIGNEALDRPAGPVDWIEEETTRA